MDDDTAYREIAGKVPLMLHRAGGYDSESIEGLRPELDDDKEDFFMHMVQEEFSAAEASLDEYFASQNISLSDIEVYAHRGDGGKWRDAWLPAMKQSVQAMYHLNLFRKSMKLGCFYQSLWHGLMFMSFMHGSIAVQQQQLINLGAKVKAGGRKGAIKAGKTLSEDSQQTELWYRVRTLKKNEPHLSLRETCRQVAASYALEKNKPCSESKAYKVYMEWEGIVQNLVDTGAFEYQAETKVLFSRYQIDPADYIKSD